MNWLFWKDYRLNRPIVIAVILFFIVPYAVVLFCYARGWVPRARLPESFLNSAIYSLILSQMCLAALGGNLIAGERADRSAEFLAYLPISRGRILTSKIMLAVAITALIWVPNLLVLMACKPQDTGYWCAVGVVAVIGLLSFSVAWLLSSLLQSAVFATMGGLITPLLLAAGIAWVAHLPHLCLNETVALWYCYVGSPLAVVSFIAGTAFYLCRVEP